MRWKLLVLVSVVAAILAVGLWSAITIVVFGSARVMAQNDWLLLCGLVIPLGVALFSGFFVYRHTAKRRKLQAVLAAIFVAVLTLATYVIASMFLHERLVIPRTREVREAR